MKPKCDLIKHFANLGFTIGAEIGVAEGIFPKPCLNQIKNNQTFGESKNDDWSDEKRWVEIKRLANFAEYIIIYDSNLSEIKHYSYEKIWSLFKYRYDYTKLNPNTAVVSNFHDLKEFK